MRDEFLIIDMLREDKRGFIIEQCKRRLMAYTEVFMRSFHNDNVCFSNTVNDVSVMGLIGLQAVNGELFDRFLILMAFFGGNEGHLALTQNREHLVNERLILYFSRIG